MQSREMKFMEAAIELSRKALETGEGGPFGCVIVSGEEIVGRGWNRVIATNDPTAHAEITAIRDACSRLGTHQLDGCELYTSCEPCPMCLGAIYWSRPQVVYFANTRLDAAAAGFDDDFIYHELSLPLQERRIRTIMLGREQALPAFRDWLQIEDRFRY